MKTTETQKQNKNSMTVGKYTATLEQPKKTVKKHLEATL